MAGGWCSSTPPRQGARIEESETIQATCYEDNKLLSRVSEGVHRRRLPQNDFFDSMPHYHETIIASHLEKSDNGIMGFFSNWSTSGFEIRCFHVSCRPSLGTRKPISDTRVSLLTLHFIH